MIQEPSSNKNAKIVLTIAVLAVLLVAGGFGVYLSGFNQNPEEKATYTGSQCQANDARCEWDRMGDTVSYTVSVTDDTTGEIILDTATDRTYVSFISTQDHVYTCSVATVNTCGVSDTATHSSTCTVPPSPTPTPEPTNTPTPTPTPTLTPTPTPTLTPGPVCEPPNYCTTNTICSTGGGVAIQSTCLDVNQVCCMPEPSPTPTATPTITPTPTHCPVPGDVAKVEIICENCSSN